MGRRHREETLRHSEQDALHKMNEKKITFIKTYHISAFLDEDAPEFKDLHPIAQGIRFSRLG